MATEMPKIGEELPLSATPMPQIGEEIPLGTAPLTIGQKIGKAAEILPTAGAVAGGLLSATAAPATMGASLAGAAGLAGLGAAAGKAGEQIIKRAVGEEAPKTSTEALKEIAKEGAWTATLDATFGKLIPLLSPVFKKVMPGTLKALQGIDERTALKVVNDPDILSRAKSMKEAGKEIGDFFEKNGFTYGRKSVKSATGKLGLSDNAADDFIVDTIGKIEAVSGTTTGKEGATKLIDLPENKEFVKQTIQEALAARYAMKDAIKRAVRSGNDEKAKMFIESRNIVDDWLETQIPGFAGVRKTYEEAAAKEAFSSVFPKNQNATTSVLRYFAALGAGAFNPFATAAISPMVGGAAIRTGAALAKSGPVAGMAELAGKGAQAITEKLTED